MKTFVFILIGFFTSQVATSQIIDKNQFNEFINNFPIRELPFTTSFNFENASEFTTPLKPISQVFCENFIFKNGIKREPDYCPLEKFDGLVYFAKYNTSFNIILVQFGYLLDGGCGGKDYLVSYLSNGLFCDTLLIYGEGYWELPSSSNPNGETYALEGTVYKDSIATLYIQHIGKIIKEEKKRKIFNRKFYRTYIVTSDGKFKMIKERKVEGYEYFTN